MSICKAKTKLFFLISNSERSGSRVRDADKQDLSRKERRSPGRIYSCEAAECSAVRPRGERRKSVKLPRSEDNEPGSLATQEWRARAMYAVHNGPLEHR